MNKPNNLSQQPITVKILVDKNNKLQVVDEKRALGSSCIVKFLKKYHN